MRRRFNRRPPFVPSGGISYAIPRRLVELNDEQAITVEFVSRRRLFGDGYSRLQSDYFWHMPPASGVFVFLFAPTFWFAPTATKPGDVDMLIVPYEGDELVLNRTLAVEIKVVRATVHKPGRSPNEFGFSQAEGLKALGFPYVAVAHLIVSEESPKEAWQEMLTFKVLDDAGNVGDRHMQLVDTLPLTLMHRTQGRLEKACSSDDIGLLSAFVRYADLEVASRYKNGIWYSEGRQAIQNRNVSTRVMKAVGDLFEARPEWWLDNPRHG